MRLLLSLAPLLLLACNPDPYPGEEGVRAHVAMRSLPKTFDPPHLGDLIAGTLAAQFYEGLLQVHPYARPYQLMGGVAEGLPEISEDGLTYTFRLRDDVTFSDDPCFPDGRGRAATAADFRYALARFAHPRTHAKGWWLLKGRIRGLDAWRDQLSRDISAELTAGREVDDLWGLDRPIPGVEVVDDRTLRLHLSAPYPQFLWVMAMPQLGVYPHEAVTFYGDGFRNHPVGTGPFTVAEFNPVYRLVLEKNPDFREQRVPDPRARPEERYSGWEDDEAAGVLARAGERIPLVDGIEARFILEDQPRWLYFKNGHADFLNPPKDNVAEALIGTKPTPEMLERGVRLLSWAELGTVYTCMNTLDPLMSNVDVRRAIALAFDHRWTIDNLYGGQATLARSLIPPGIGGHDPNYHPYQSDDGHSQVERAREHLARAGYPGGIDPETGRALRLRFDSSGTGVTQRHFAARFTDEMRRLGIEVDVIVNTFPQLTGKMRTGAFQIAGLAWSLDYPDAQNILQLLYGPNKAPGSNRANFVNPRFDELFEQTSVLPDGPERSEMYAEMARIVADEVPWVTRVHRIRPNLQHSWLQGFKYTEVSHQYWRYIGIDGEERARLRAEWNQPTRWPLLVLVVLALGLMAISRTTRTKTARAGPRNDGTEM